MAILEASPRIMRPQVQTLQKHIMKNMRSDNSRRESSCLIFKTGSLQRHENFSVDASLNGIHEFLK
ncbi:hypothetical protein BofuT4_uP065580.1 [Botrytis cinerea T4]|uniref:Uncharacterized protein n=1 Tax=Botryotinia fuckeliana (strain T4) TaxID=999810 RepID=G2XS00_BOTF4|nr:hypothetical protein BofuT4_uP065580.1 [Botrytis cinerea T4]